MPTLITRAGDVFETGCEWIDVTSLHRPDTAWRVIDATGHEHRWYTNGHPADGYNANLRHHVPSLVWIHDEWRYDEDGERYEVGHHECRECGARIEPGYTADSTTQYIPGLRWCRINGEHVTLEEFQRRLAKANGE